MSATVTLRTLLSCALVLMPLAGIIGLRLGGHDMHTSLVRMGNPTRAVATIMGARDESTEVELQEMQAIDQYWFAFEHVDVDTLQRIASDMAIGEHRLGARSVACMSARPRLGLEEARADDVHVCVGGSEDDLGIERCTPADWQAQGGRLVLLSLVGQHARLERAELIESCQVNARHWREWHQRQ
jgi:hypothetical protein